MNVIVQILYERETVIISIDSHLSRRAKALATLPDNLETLLLFTFSSILVIYPTKEKWIKANLHPQYENIPGWLIYFSENVKQKILRLKFYGILQLPISKPAQQNGQRDQFASRFWESHQTPLSEIGVQV